MPRKKMSPEARAAASERMRQMHARKLAAKKAQEVADQVDLQLKAIHDAPEAPGDTGGDQAITGPSPESDFHEPSMAELLTRIEEIQKTNQILQLAVLGKGSQNSEQALQGPQATSQGMVGHLEKYNTDPAMYPDPRERLSNEPRLKRFAFIENYNLEFNVLVTQYTNQDQIRIREPRFEMELLGIMFDEDGEPTNRRYIARRAVFHEDPEAALAIAREQKLDVESMGEKEFLDEMRYLRFRDWLFDFFYPPKPQSKIDKKQMVIGNQIVETFEIASEDSQDMFDHLKKF